MEKRYVQLILITLILVGILIVPASATSFVYNDPTLPALISPSVQQTSSSGNSRQTICLSMGNINTVQNNLSFGGLVCQDDNCFVSSRSGNIEGLSLSWRQGGGAVVAGNEGAFQLNLTLNGNVMNTYYYPYVATGYKSTFVNDSLNIALSKDDNVSVQYHRLNGTFGVGFPSYCMELAYD